MNPFGKHLPKQLTRIALPSLGKASVVGQPTPPAIAPAQEASLAAGGSQMLAMLSPGRVFGVGCQLLSFAFDRPQNPGGGQCAYFTVAEVNKQQVGEDFAVVGYDLSVKSTDNDGGTAAALRGAVPWGNQWGERACIVMGLRSDMKWLAAKNRWSFGPDSVAIVGRDSTADAEHWNLDARGVSTILARAFPPGRLGGFGSGELAPCRVDNWTSRDTPLCVRVPENDAFCVAVAINGDDYEAEFQGSSESGADCSILGQLLLAVRGTSQVF